MMRVLVLALLAATAGCAARAAVGARGVDVSMAVLRAEQESTLSDAGIQSKSSATARTVEFAEALITAPAGFWSWISGAIVPRALGARGLGPGADYQPPSREEWLARAKKDKEVADQLEKRLQEYWLQMAKGGSE